jgi:hypothetical protein
MQVVADAEHVEAERLGPPGALDETVGIELVTDLRAEPDPLVERSVHAETVTRPDPARQQKRAIDPRFLPGGRRVARGSWG